MAKKTKRDELVFLEDILDVLRRLKITLAT